MTTHTALLFNAIDAISSPSANGIVSLITDVCICLCDLRCDHNETSIPAPFKMKFKRKIKNLYLFNIYPLTWAFLGLMWSQLRFV